jgi:hypothetical protein
MLQEVANVDCSYNLTPEQLYEKVAQSDALIVRSATKVGGRESVGWCLLRHFDLFVAAAWQQRLAAAAAGGRQRQWREGEAAAVPHTHQHSVSRRTHAGDAASV